MINCVLQWKKIVNDLSNRFINEFKKKDRSGVYGFTQRKIAYNSNRIEGSKLTENQIASLLKLEQLKVIEILLNQRI